MVGAYIVASSIAEIATTEGRLYNPSDHSRLAAHCHQQHLAGVPPGLATASDTTGICEKETKSGSTHALPSHKAQSWRNSQDNNRFHGSATTIKIIFKRRRVLEESPWKGSSSLRLLQIGLVDNLGSALFDFEHAKCHRGPEGLHRRVYLASLVFRLSQGQKYKGWFLLLGEVIFSSLPAFSSRNQ